MYIQANIGRNVTMHEALTNEVVGTEPMSDYLWNAFQEATKEAIVRAIVRALPENAWPGHPATDTFEVHTGTGTWEGHTEESAHVSLYFEHDGHTWTSGVPGGQGWHDVKPALRLALDDSLTRLAHQWGQEAIAYLVTDSALAMAETAS
jgi:hypothetical protein